MILTAVLLAIIGGLFLTVLALHSWATEREQRQLAAAFERARALQWQRTAGLIHWPETEPMCFHRGAQ